MKRALILLFVVLGWVFFLASTFFYPALGLRDEIHALRCDVFVYAESRGADLGDIERCEE